METKVYQLKVIIKHNRVERRVKIYIGDIGSIEVYLINGKFTFIKKQIRRYLYDYFNKWTTSVIKEIFEQYPPDEPVQKYLFSNNLKG